MQKVKKAIANFFIFFVKLIYKVIHKEFTDNDRHVWLQFFGFVIVGSHAPYSHPFSDYSICEAYVLPEYRKRGLMTSVVCSLVEECPGKYSLLVLDHNEYAKNFWSKVFASMRYVPYDLDFGAVDSHGDHLCLFGFKPGGGC